jgi:hypothetical protein
MTAALIDIDSDDQPGTGPPTWRVRISNPSQQHDQIRFCNGSGNGFTHFGTLNPFP